MLGLAGVVVLMGPWAIDWSAREVVIGHVFLLGAGLGWAVAMTVLRHRPPQGAMLQLLPWCFGLATLALLPLALLEGGGIGTWPAPSLAAMAYIGVLAGPVGTWCVMAGAAVAAGHGGLGGVPGHAGGGAAAVHLVAGRAARPRSARRARR